MLWAHMASIKHYPISCISKGPGHQNSSLAMFTPFYLSASCRLAAVGLTITHENIRPGSQLSSVKLTFPLLRVHRSNTPNTHNMHCSTFFLYLTQTMPLCYCFVQSSHQMHVFLKKFGRTNLLKLCYLHQLLPACSVSVKFTFLPLNSN